MIIVKNSFLLGLFLTKILFNTDLGKNYENQFDNEYESVKFIFLIHGMVKLKKIEIQKQLYQIYVKTFVSKTDKLNI